MQYIIRRSLIVAEATTTTELKRSGRVTDLTWLPREIQGRLTAMVRPAVARRPIDGRSAYATGSGVGATLITAIASKLPGRKLNIAAFSDIALSPGVTVRTGLFSMAPAADAQGRAVQTVAN